jgi:hypothetical protein
VQGSAPRVATLASSSRCDRYTIKIIKKFAHSMSTNVQCPAELISPRSIAEGRNDRCGYARVYQAVPYALRDLSPVSATAVVGISKCLAQRPGLTGCSWASRAYRRGYEAGSRATLYFSSLPYRPSHARRGLRRGGRSDGLLKLHDGVLLSWTLCSKQARRLGVSELTPIGTEPPANTMLCQAARIGR